MSTSEILSELSHLAAADLLAVRRRLIELAEENEDIALCDASALEGAQMLDRMEAEDGSR